MNIIKDFIKALYESFFPDIHYYSLGRGYIQAPEETILNDFAPDWALEWEEVPTSKQMLSGPNL